MSDERLPCEPELIALLLLPAFTMMPVTSIIETLRLSNQISGTELYRWTLHSQNGKPVTASNGMLISVDGEIAVTPSDATLMVCGGYDALHHADAATVRWLRHAAHGKQKIGGVCTGVEVLAAAGLLDGYACSLHWEVLPAFGRSFPHLSVTGHYYDIDRDRLTCAGGTAAVDMMLAMIGARHGTELATAIAECMIHPATRTRDERQPNSVAAEIGTRYPKLLAVIKRMEETLDTPLRPSSLAKSAGLSIRQLERLFQRYLSRSPKQYHQQLRLQHARLMLIQTCMSVTEVSAACGFSNPSHFSRCYTSAFHRPPKEERGIPHLEAA